MNSEVNFEDILKDSYNEEDLIEIPLADKVFRVFVFILVISSFFLILKFMHLSVINKQFFSERAELNMSDSKIQRAPRGIIFDKFEEPLLTNKPSVRIFISPRDFPSSPEERIKKLKDISNVLGLNFDEIKNKISEKDWEQSDKLFLKDNLENDELVSISSMNFSGIYIEPSFKRSHIEVKKFSHVLGFVGLVNEEDLDKNKLLSIDDEIGKAGIEKQYDFYIRGENGEVTFIRNAFGKEKDRIVKKNPKPGNLIYTNIDGEFQSFLYNRLALGLKELSRDVGFVIALNPQNGEVLAMTGIPSFDVEKISDSLNLPNNPFFNRGISGLYNPGSTIKPLVAVAALSEGVIDTKKQIFSAGYIDIPNPYNPEKPSRFVDWKPNGWVDVYSALAKSSNIFFYEITGGFENQRGIGIEKLKDWWKIFSLDLKTGIDMPNEKSGFLPDPILKEKEIGDPWRLGDTYNVSIGQGDLQITPIELLNYISAIANGGKLYKPQIVKVIKDENGNEIKRNEPVLSKDITQKIEKFVSEVRKGMRDVVEKEYGTAHSLSFLPINVAAKTGTSQVENNSKVNAFFVGYAPYENPQLALVILIENAREGSLNTIPIAKDAFVWYYENRLKSR